MKLYLMRHGHAAEADIDPTRGLTNEGKLDIERIAQTLLQKEIHIECVIHSTKKRAQQTAEIVASNIAPNIKLQPHDSIKPVDNPELVVPEINTLKDNTLVTSHLPFLPSLVILLTNDTSPIRFSPGTVVCLNKTSDSQWSVDWVVN